MFATQGITAPVALIGAAALAWAVSGCAPHCIAHRVQDNVRRALAPVPVVVQDAPAGTPVPALLPAMPEVAVGYLGAVAHHAPLARVAPVTARTGRAWACADWSPLDSSVGGQVQRCEYGPSPVAPAATVAFAVIQ